MIYVFWKQMKYESVQRLKVVVSWLKTLLTIYYMVEGRLEIKQLQVSASVNYSDLFISSSSFENLKLRQQNLQTIVQIF